MFELQNHQAKVTNYNATTEKHGEENVPAGDVKIEVTGTNRLLDAFASDYRGFLYTKPGVGDQPGLLDEIPDGLTVLKHPNLDPLHLKEEFPGYVLIIESGLGIAEPLVLKDAKLTGFSFRALDGGSLVLTFNARVKPSQEQSGQLHYLVKNTIEISLQAPAAAAQQQTSGNAGDPEGGDTLDAQEAQEEAERLSQLGQAA